MGQAAGEPVGIYIYIYSPHKPLWLILGLPRQPASSLLACASVNIFTLPPPITGKSDKCWDLRSNRSCSPSRFVPTCVFDDASRQRLRLISELLSLKLEQGKTKLVDLKRKRKREEKTVNRSEMTPAQKNSSQQKGGRTKERKQRCTPIRSKNRCVQKEVRRDERENR